MKKLILTLALLLLAVPASAAWDITPSTVTWQGQAATALVQEVVSAVVWERDRHSGFWGLLVTAAAPGVTVTNLGDGTSRLDIAMPRGQAEAWITATAAADCPEASTNAEALACVDEVVREDLRSLLRRYRRAQQPDITDPDPLEDP